MKRTYFISIDGIGINGNKITKDVYKPLLWVWLGDKLVFHLHLDEYKLVKHFTLNDCIYYNIIRK